MVVETQRIGRDGLWAVDLACGVVLIAGAVTPWVRSGQGESLGGLDLADQLLSGPPSTGWAPAAGGALYAAVAFGAILVGTSSLRGRRVRIARIAACVTMLVTLAGLAVLGWLSLSSWDLGPLLAAIALTLCATANLVSTNRG